jgi:hypothetical protein
LGLYGLVILRIQAVAASQEARDVEKTYHWYPMNGINVSAAYEKYVHEQLKAHLLGRRSDRFRELSSCEPPPASALRKVA